MTREELALLRSVSASQGIMLETASERLSQKGGPHYGSPDKWPERRLETIRLAGELAIPFTTGILIGIGETRAERLEALAEIRALHDRYGHIQEVIVQNFRAKPATKMAAHPEPTLDELLWTVRAARDVLGEDMKIQVPPNLSYDEFPRLLEAGIDDWGGVSPVTIDHVNPEAPWPEIERLRRATEAAGHELAARLPIYPDYVADLDRWADARVAREIRLHADADGLARDDRWAAGAEVPCPPLVNANGRGPGAAVAAALAKVRDGVELDEDDVTDLFRARGADFHAVVEAADLLRREVCGDTVSYVVTRNINYTNVCYFRCGFCAFSKGKLAENLRGAPYLVPIDEIVRRCQEAWERGAVEVCLQGGIHPGFTGDYYAHVCEAIKRRLPDLHVHAFSALEVWQGAATLGVSLAAYLAALEAPGASPRCREPPRRSSTTRSGASSAPTRSRPRSGSASTTRRTVSACARRRRSCSGRSRARAAGPASPRAPRPAEEVRRVHGVRAASVRAHGGADLPEGTRASLGRRSARRSSCTRSGGWRCIPTSRTSRPRG